MSEKRKKPLTREQASTLEDLQAYLQTMPEPSTAATMKQACRDSVEKATHTRGDPFGQNDLIVLAREDGRTVQVPAGRLPVRVGRGKKADLIVEGPDLSRIHCVLERDGLFVRIADLDSKNGTYLNGRKIASEYLCEGDEVRLGTVTLTVGRG